MRRRWIAIATVGVLVAVAMVAWYYYFYSQHVIFSTVKHGLALKAYCTYKGTFTFATYVEVRRFYSGTLISVNEIPPSTDDLADCRMRHPIADIRPDPTYSCLIISFHENERPLLAIPLALKGLDLPEGGEGEGRKEQKPFLRRTHFAANVIEPGGVAHPFSRRRSRVPYPSRAVLARRVGNL